MLCGGSSREQDIAGTRTGVCVGLPRPPRLADFAGAVTIELGGQTISVDHPRLASARDQPPADVLPAPHRVH